MTCPMVTATPRNIRAILSTSVEVDEDELDAELEALGEEVELGGGWEAEGSTAVPDFLKESNSVPEFLEEPPVPGQIKEAV